MKTFTRATLTAVLAGSILLAGSAAAMATPSAAVADASSAYATTHHQAAPQPLSFPSYEVSATGTMSNGFMTSGISGGRFVGPDGMINASGPEFGLTENATVTPTVVSGTFNFIGYGKDGLTTGTLRGSNHVYSGTLHLWDGEAVTITNLTLIPAGN